MRIAGAPPREEALDRDAFAPEVELGAPVIFKQLIESGYNVSRATHFTRPLFDMLSSQRYRDVYRCG